MYLYIHGFLSSSQSAKAQAFKHWLTQQGRGAQCHCPDLPVEPIAAMRLLSEYIESADRPLKLVGSSLGGFYATVLSERYDLKAAVINPAVHAGLLLQQKIGAHKAWHSDEEIIFTQAHADSLNAIDLLTISRPDNILLLAERGDETLDYRLATAFYRDCHQLIFNGGNHSFTRFEQILPLIDAF